MLDVDSHLLHLHHDERHKAHAGDGVPAIVSTQRKRPRHNPNDHEDAELREIAKGHGSFGDALAAAQRVDKGGNVLADGKVPVVTGGHMAATGPLVDELRLKPAADLVHHEHRNVLHLVHEVELLVLKETLHFVLVELETPQVLLDGVRKADRTQHHTLVAGRIVHPHHCRKSSIAEDEESARGGNTAGWESQVGPRTCTHGGPRVSRGSASVSKPVRATSTTDAHHLASSPTGGLAPGGGATSRTRIAGKVARGINDGAPECASLPPPRICL
mmetsp:Transcript_7096/g.20580  ORF Transcript_7096/g.20580 Transcript_7096/m.20580 type:complete len:273 (-) Transcript_7096:462-1280(-)